MKKYDQRNTSEAITPAQYYNSVLRENKMLFPDVDWEDIAEEFRRFGIRRSTPLTQLANANLIAPWVLQRFLNFRNPGLTTAISLLLGTPLAYLITEGMPNSDGAILLSMVPDTFERVNLSPLERAHLNFVRASIGICLFG